MPTDPYVPAGGSSAPGSSARLMSSDGYKATYRYCNAPGSGGQGTAPVATPTDFIQIVGSATMTGRIKRIALWGISTAAGSMLANLVRRSTIGTIGSAVVTGITGGKHDPNDAAPSVTVGTIGTANWTTPGTAAGQLGAQILTFSNAGAVSRPCIWDFSNRMDKALILRGVSDWIYVNLNGDTLPTGGKITFEIEIEEDNS